MIATDAEVDERGGADRLAGLDHAGAEVAQGEAAVERGSGADAEAGERAAEIVHPYEDRAGRRFEGEHMPEGKAEVCARRDQESLGVRAVGHGLPARPGCQVRERDRLHRPADHESGAVEGIREAECREAQADGEEQRADLAVDAWRSAKAPSRMWLAAKPRSQAIAAFGWPASASPK